MNWQWVELESGVLQWNTWGIPDSGWKGEGTLTRWCTLILLEDAAQWRIAAYKADFDTCKFLIKKGGFLDVMDVNHQTPHQRALWSDNHALLELLAA